MTDPKLEQAKLTLQEWTPGASNRRVADAVRTVLDALAEAGREIERLEALVREHSADRRAAEERAQQAEAKLAEAHSRLSAAMRSAERAIGARSKAESQCDAAEAREATLMLQLSQTRSLIAQCIAGDYVTDFEDETVRTVIELKARETKLRKANLGLASALAESQGREAELKRRVAVLDAALAASPEPADPAGMGWVRDSHGLWFPPEPAPPEEKP